ncbi:MULTISPECIES: ROK family protein [unclassified Clostridium]|uniref:ROK family protein n=1 Tax=unclassified Clostridium TaxID=2614128 RepID=UPI0025BCB665|nr:ROK family protein [Clostridium sp.]MCI6691746.1 ROK family protein [Clostridium sp.]MDY2632679.1 ROK family protein [Clostridium sp.]MDY4251693.1 ROK family protein [Clostridium sp.]MDY6227149.1 ROK family protein [Clostridium sp.]
MKKKYVVGVDLGGTKIYTALVDLDGNIVKEVTVKTEAQKGDAVVLDKIIKTIDDVLIGTDIDEIKAIGVGSPGPLDVENGLIVYTPNLPFKNFNIVKPIKEKYKIDTYLDNDANVATLSEYMFGAGKGSKNMVYVTVSTGIGGGAILNGSLFRGSTSNALEIGHITVMKGGPRCGCGNTGCAEALASGTAIMKRAKEAIESKVETSLKNYEEVTAKEVFLEAEKGDKVSKDILNDALSYLGITISNIANSFDPDKIIIGGGVSEAGRIVFDKIDYEMERRCLKTIYNNCKIEKAVLGSKAGVLGAAALAILESK